MANARTPGTPPLGTFAQDEVVRLARDAISQLANQGPSGVVPRERRMAEFCTAFLSQNEDARRNAISQLISDGISTNDLIDHVIPEAARIVGQQWADDELSFAEVSIASARLQEAVRTLSARRSARNMTGFNAPKILLIIPRNEHHTLGVFVAADQFKRLGFAVDISIDQTPREIALAVRKNRYVMAGITVAGRRSLAPARDLVDIIRSAVTRVTPVIIGGSLVGSDLNLRSLTGADHAVVSVPDAIEKCGLQHYATAAQKSALVGQAT